MAPFCDNPYNGKYLIFFNYSQSENRIEIMRQYNFNALRYNLKQGFYRPHPTTQPSSIKIRRWKDLQVI